MEIIIAIIGIILGIGLIIWLLGIVFYIIAFIFGIIWSLLKWFFKISPYILALGILGFLYNKVGLIVVVLPVAYIVYRIIRSSYKKKSLSGQVKQYFYNVEMSSLSDLVSYLKKRQTVNYQELLNILDEYMAEGLLQNMEFGNSAGNPVFRWTENRRYPKGVITKSITLS